MTVSESKTVTAHEIFNTNKTQQTKEDKHLIEELGMFSEKVQKYDVKISSEKKLAEEFLIKMILFVAFHIHFNVLIGIIPKR